MDHDCFEEKKIILYYYSLYHIYKLKKNICIGKKILPTYFIFYSSYCKASLFLTFLTNELFNVKK